MEVIFPWERDDIVVRSTEQEADEGAGGPAFASALAALSGEIDTAARIRTLAEGVRALERSSDLEAEEVIARIEAMLDADEASTD